MKRISFIHTSDLHLGCPFKGLNHMEDSVFQSVMNSTFDSFIGLIDYAILHQVDFLLIAGDLFDDSKRSLKSQFFLRDQLNRLKHHKIMVYIIHGNHDHLGGKFHTLKWPEHVHIFQSNQVECVPYLKNGETLAHIYGFSYLSAAEYERKINSYQKIGNSPFHIGLYHGTMVGEGAHEPYAPFTLEEIKGTKMDYYALGHIHKQQILNTHPHVVYSGNIQGLSRKETGPKGGYHVVMSEAKTELTFLPTSKVEWENISLDISEMHNLDELITWIEEWKEQNKGKISKLYVLTLEGISHHWVPSNKNEWDEVSEVINANEAGSDCFCYLTEIRNETNISLAVQDEIHCDPYYVELIKCLENLSLYSQAMKELFKNKLVYAHFHETEFIEQEIIFEANKRILGNLWKEGNL